MALLIGQEAEGSGTAVAPATEIAWAWQYEALSTGKVEALHVIFSSVGTAATVNVALMSDEGGKPGSVLAEASFSGSTAGAHEVAIAATEITAATKYWLVQQGQGGSTKVKEGSTTASRKANAKHAKISETTSAQWVAEEKRGPISIWGTGTESGGGTPVVGKATGAMLLTGTATGVVRSVVSGKATGALLLAGTATGTVRAVVEGKATGALLLTGTAKGQVAGALKGKASGAILLTGSATGVGRAVKLGKATGALTLNGTSKGSLRAVVTATASGTLRFTGFAVPISGGEPNSAVLTITSLPAARLAITSLPAARITVTSQPAAVIRLSNAGEAAPALFPSDVLFPSDSLFPH